MLNDAVNYLRGKGYAVDFQLTPTIGAFKKPDTPMLVAKDASEPGSLQSSPFHVADPVGKDKQFKMALVTVIAGVLKSFEATGSPSGMFQSDPKVKEAVKVLRNRTKTDYLFVVIGNGVIVPASKQLGQILTTGLLTGIATLGMVSVAVYDADFLDTYVGLVDLETAEILWENSLRSKGVNPTSSGFYSYRWWAEQWWAKDIFYHLPGRAP